LFLTDRKLSQRLLGVSKANVLLA